MKFLTSKQMSKVDNLAVAKYNIQILQMMENAGRSLADFAANLKPRRVIVLFGKGNNGGGGLVAARHLKIKGFNVKVIRASPSKNKIVLHQLKTLKNMKIAPLNDAKIEKGDIIIDSLLGYNIKGNPKGNYAKLIKKANFSKNKVISLDLPSGLNPNSGECYNPCIKADYTLTLALPKIGLKNINDAVGKLYLVNIGIPNELYENEFGFKVRSIFRNGNIVRI